MNKTMKNLFHWGFLFLFLLWNVNASASVHIIPALLVRLKIIITRPGTGMYSFFSVGL